MSIKLVKFVRHFVGFKIFFKVSHKFQNFLKLGKFFEMFQKFSQNFPKITLIYLKFALKFCQAFLKTFQEFSEIF